VVPIADDELFTSWINRMASANAFKSKTNFYYNYILEKEYSSSFRKTNSLHFITDFCERFNFNEKVLSSPILVIRKHFNYFISLQFRTDMSIWYTIKNRTESDGIKFFHYLNTEARVIKYCPLCQKEAIEKLGVGYLSVEHSIDINKLCRIHKIPLISKSHKLIANSDNVTGQEEIYLAYADAIHYLYNFDFIINQTIFKKQIHEKIKFLKPNGIVTIDFIMDLYDKSIFSSLPYKRKYAKRQLFDTVANRRETTLEFYIILILLLFGSMDIFLKEILIPRLTKDTKDFFNDNKDFSLLEEAYGLLRVKHSCGYEFVTTSYIVNKYCNCPKCVTDFDREFATFIGANSGGSFIPDQYPKYNSTKFNVYHKPCSKTFTTNLYGIFKGFSCPNCRHITLDSEIYKNRIYNKSNGEYSALDEYKGIGIYIRVKHNKCETIFPFEPSSSTNLPCCPLCKKRRDTEYLTEYYKQEVFDLVCDEYTVIGQYVRTSINVEMKHDICGLPIFITPHNFKNGRRCTNCKIYFTKESFELFVKDKSNGLYKIIDYPNKDNATIQNTRTGEAKSLLRTFIRQELERPTPSLVLPVE